jgi:hypothetical protein
MSIDEIFSGTQNIRTLQSHSDCGNKNGRLKKNNQGIRKSSSSRIITRLAFEKSLESQPLDFYPC